MKMKKLVIEMVAVGVLFTAIAFPVTWGIQLASEGKAELWPSHAWGMVAGTFLSGALLHLAFEAGGLNARYCRQYTPLF